MALSLRRAAPVLVAIGAVASLGGVAPAWPEEPDPAADAPPPAADDAPATPPAAAPAAPGDGEAEAAPPRAPSPEPESPASVDPPDHETIVIVQPLPPGSAHVIGREELERFERDDIHKVLAAIPGVNVRHEEGYGFRPNIGMRGAASERSAKIALMEDGIPIAPAPYSAPAAYYFPLMTRMVSVEVTKGPASIAYGPNTVGGAINLHTRPIPWGRELTLDLAGGSDLYGKMHATYGESGEHFGILVEGVKLRSDGFKQLDGGGSTGFDKHEVALKGVVRGRAGRGYHELTLKLGYSDEASNETYTGLSDADFARTPYRRYAGTQLDHLDWWHSQVQLSHRLSVGSTVLTTTVYRHDFSRDWRKLNGFATDRSLSEILANPDAGLNAVFYEVLAGEEDSSSPSEALVVGTAERDFLSQGLQLVGTADVGWFGVAHTVEAGVRYHEDAARRFHFEETFAMRGGRMVRDEMPRTVSRDATGSAQAVAAYYKHQVTLGRFRVTAGVRGEFVRTRWEDHADPTRDSSASFAVAIPGGGVIYQPTASLAFLVGVHKGYVPVAPGEADDTRPEESVNVEAGVRWATPRLTTEAIGFFSDYSNLKGTCTFSSGCDPSMVDEEFDGGRVHVYGVEAVAATELHHGRLRFPANLTYTFTRSRFQTSFTSDNPEWGDVSEGDELPYLPEHQLALQTGVRGRRWEIAAAGRYVSAMRDTAGQGTPEPGDATDATLVLDLSAAVEFGRWGKAYLTVDNVLDETSIVSRRPYGARPGVPRLVVLGYKGRF